MSEILIFCLQQSWIPVKKSSFVYCNEEVIQINYLCTDFMKFSTSGTPP